MVTIAAVTSDGFSHDRFLVDQVIRPVANLYRITPLAIGETPAGGPIAYVRQKKLAVKEDIRFYADEQETNELFRIKARSLFDIGGARYDVADPAGHKDASVAWGALSRTNTKPFALLTGPRLDTILKAMKRRVWPLWLALVIVAAIGT